jgi:hypothetical protein
MRSSWDLSVQIAYVVFCFVTFKDDSDVNTKLNVFQQFSESVKRMLPGKRQNRTW